ncbi:DUF3209 family protein [Cystobacter ferrugineus]|uniref:DUF3209 domain-containing protein n=1 Tax=Cystobacter ferrugineus TaxID=83449 RepID=A0A1L9AYB8_9BACT|nr:DUF3209 family protein [Cystobacter ferrugineus]OJH35009.1 DUF3209 domain-containing protein [Cystobacter ferrugineus]
MACHELAALRLALMNILGVDDAAERQHELAELGSAAETPGPVRSLMQARDMAGMLRFFEASLVELQEKVSATRADDPKMPYLRSLLVLTKSVELELRRQNESLQRLWRDLEEVHDFTHEIYPRD